MISALGQRALPLGAAVAVGRNRQPGKIYTPCGIQANWKVFDVGSISFGITGCCEEAGALET